MSKSEKRVEQDIQLAAAHIGCTLFKNNVGSAYRCAKNLMHWTAARWLVMKKPVFLSYGLGGIKGSSDQIGITEIVITPEMVGRKVGIFTAVEVKKDKYGSYGATAEQKAFIKMVKSRGAIAGVCDCVEDLETLIEEYKVC